MSYRRIPITQRRHFPPWDGPVHGYDAGSIGQHFLHQWIPELFDDPDHKRVGEVCMAIEDMLRDANEYGADQVRFKFLYPRRCSIHPVKKDGSLGNGLGSYYECRFCKATTSGGPDEIVHAPTCSLIDHEGRRTVTDGMVIIAR